MIIISDLHLQAGREDITNSLLDLLADRAGKTDKLVILGDLFEVWIGDDDENPLAGRVAAALQTLSQTGVEIMLMHGNRDFLLGPDYAARCGARLIEDPWVFSHQGEAVALLHGDTLCSDDHDYQKFRVMVRDPGWQQAFLAKPLAERQAFARDARRQSRENNRYKSQTIMDVNRDAVIRLMQSFSVTTLIHGHTHRPDVHQVDLGNGISGRRIVLGDWDSQGWLVELSAAGIKLEHFPLLAGDAAG
ncbi:MAG: UDP-2,3-diacylglucosamine diphosphatase [Pseudohongiellaceae bacterium]